MKHCWDFVPVLFWAFVVPFVCVIFFPSEPLFPMMSFNLPPANQNSPRVTCGVCISRWFPFMSFPSLVSENDHHWSSSGCPCYGLRIACLLAVSIFLFHFILIHLLVSKVIWTISTDVFQQPFQKFFGLLMKVARLLKHGTAFQPFWAKKGHKKFAFRRPSPTSSSRSSPTRRTPPWPSRILALAWQRTNWSTT